MPEFNREEFVQAYAKYAYDFTSGKGSSEAPNISNYNSGIQMALNLALIGVMTDDTKATAESLNITPEQFKNWEIAEAMSIVQASYDRGLQEAKRKQNGHER